MKQRLEPAHIINIFLSVRDRLAEWTSIQRWTKLVDKC